MTTTIVEFAAARGISVQRARQLAREGKVTAERRGRTWVIIGPAEPKRSRRPLSQQSQADLTKFLSTRSFDHVTGHRKIRLAGRLRSLRSSENPGAEMRGLYGDSPRPVGFGGASIVRAALDGKDQAVRESFHQLLLRENLPTPQAVARKVRDARALAGISAIEAAELTGMTPEMFRVLEARGEVPLGNVTAVKVLKTLSVPLPAVIRAREAQVSP